MVFVGWEHQVDPLSGLQLTSCWICRKSISLLLINAGSVNYSKVTLWRRVWVDNTPSPRCSEIAAHRQMSRNQVEPHVDPFPADRSLNLARGSILKVCRAFKVSRSDPASIKAPHGITIWAPELSISGSRRQNHLLRWLVEEIHSLSGDNPPDRQEKIILVGGEKSWWMKREILLAGEDEILLFEETGEGPSGGNGVGRGVGSRWWKRPIYFLYRDRPFSLLHCWHGPTSKSGNVRNRLILTNISIL